MTDSFAAKIRARRSGVCVYGLAPPKRATAPDRRAEITARHAARLGALRPDAVIVYDIQDEPGRADAPRPFPFLPTVDPLAFARDDLADVAAPKIVYRSVGGDDEASLADWLARLAGNANDAAVFVGQASAELAVRLPLRDAYALARARAPEVLLGGIAIAERHARREDEHLRILGKAARGCSFFVTQAVYDVTASKSLLSDLHLACAERAEPVPPVLLTFSPCASVKTLELMKWLGISFPRWLDNELRHADDPLLASERLCLSIFDELADYAAAKGIPLGVNVESVSIRKAEIEASVRLFEALRDRMETTT